ncbi:isocitrate lyase/PEP mutase family protein [Actinocorallia populi]|uniref:isocitrate lyase/PEP mutase family protein n=1 Tax=Actinocorallia populi TaxID=2079200 RepID=UPI000D090C6B|nr:isocitrate lyase/phosphoenolpyruvate mutase family protein [Actinocorallia populi]
MENLSGTGLRALFKELHHAEAPLVLPNAWDYASAAALVSAGFSAVGTTSLGVAAAAGKPDAEAATAAETLALAETLARLPCPVTVDLEGGFGRAEELAVRLSELGIAGVNLEDGGLADPAELCAMIRRVKESAPDLFVNARTDTFWLAAPRPLESALERVRAYAEAGADGVFVPAITADDDIAAVVAAVDVPVNVLFMPGRHTVAGLAELGVRRISMGSLLFRAALGAAVRTASAVRDGAAIEGGAPSYEEVNSLVSPRASRPAGGPR